MLDDVGCVAGWWMCQKLMDVLEVDGCVTHW